MVSLAIFFRLSCVITPLTLWAVFEEAGVGWPSEDTEADSEGLDRDFLTFACSLVSVGPALAAACFWWRFLCAGSSEAGFW